MGWRFRKIFQSGPFRWTFSKSGVGWSIGIPILRYGKSPTGNSYISFGIPGTGLYFIKYFNKNKHSSEILIPRQYHEQPLPLSTTTVPPQISEPWWKGWQNKTQK